MNSQEIAKAITATPYMQRILDRANHDHACFEMWLKDHLSMLGVDLPPDWLLEALNSGDGVYRP